MKKFVYIIALLVITSISITSCTKEEVKPKTNNGTVGDPIKE